MDLLRNAARRKRVLCLAGTYAWPIATAAVCGILLYGQWGLVGDWRVDDAYITFSYAKNLGEGRGPIYSHDVRVEGYSNFLWMVLLSIGYAISAKVNVYALARVLAMAWLVAAGVATWRLARRFAGPLAAGASLVLLACSTDLVRAAMSGLETVPYAALLTLGFLAYLTEPADRRRFSLYWFVAAALMRIDGFVPLGFIVLYEILSSLTTGRFRWQALLRWVAAPMAIYVAFFAWRFAYYGHLFPMTYYAKTGVSASDVHRGSSYVWDTLRSSGMAAALPVVLVGFGRRPRNEAICIGSFLVLMIAYVIHMGGDWMPFARFLIPLAFLWSVLLAWGASAVWKWSQSWGAPGLLGSSATFAFVYWFCTAHLDARTIETPQEQAKEKYATDVASHTRNHLLAAVPYLRLAIRNPGERLVTDYGGVFALETSASVIEMWGLCNETIALRGTWETINPVYGKTCVPCYAEFHPDYFHSDVPLVRNPNGFRDPAHLIANIFQGPALDRVLDLKTRYAVGRVLNTTRNDALFFLERRRPGIVLERREPAPGFVVDYPFETKSSVHSRVGSSS